MDSAITHDLTVPQPDMPLPAPTTVSLRSLQPRRERECSARSGSRSTSSPSRSRASSVVRYMIIAEGEAQAEGAIGTVHETVSGAIGGTAEADASPGSSSIDALAAEEAGVERTAKRRKLDETPETNPRNIHAPASSLSTDVYAAQTGQMDKASINTLAIKLKQNSGKELATGGNDRLDSGHRKHEDGNSKRVTTPGPSGRGSAPQRPMSAAPTERCAGAKDFATPGETAEAESSKMAQQRGVVIDVDALMDMPPIAGPSSAPMVAGSSGRVPHTAISSADISTGSGNAPGDASDSSVRSAEQPLSAYNCPICFSPPIRATLTPCGHVCCGECLFTAIRTTMQRASYTAPVGERLIARCPVCRAPIPGWDGRGGGVIGLKPKLVYTL